ncbi:MAG: pyridoxamine 5'-phosphate oxidase family protein [Chloroflexi bacterium]|nr:pyridoxamine 5'-phosphate oxidase family protein [Chloroflexota bacterium]
MAITLDPQEMEAFLQEKKTLVLTTLRRDGSPVSVPMWFVYHEGCVYMHSLKRGAKVHNVRRDARVCLAAESGERWAGLKAVVIQGRCAVLEDPAEVARFDAAYNQKYAGLTRPDEVLPQRVKDHYAGPWVVLRVTPEKVRTWDNSKIRLATPAR